MKRLLFWLVVIAGVAAVGAAGYHKYYAARSVADQYRLKTVRHTDISLVVNSSGTVQPVQNVQIGAFISGPIQKVLVDFNDKVNKDQVLAEIDPRTYKSAVAHEEASLLHAKADLLRVKALLEQAVRNERRAKQLEAQKAISVTDVDQFITDRKSLEAQVALGEAMIQECDASLDSAKTNLEFTQIKSPVDGVVTDRKVDPGQTMAAQFQTPVMFQVAPDLEKKVYIYASVDEADIGLIREAQGRKEPVVFVVDAYPKDSFQGRIAQVRLNPTTVSNVVTYTVIVEASNAELKLLPGMTANLTFQIEKHPGVLGVPNAALRFHPKVEQVQASDREIVEGAEDETPQADTPSESQAKTDAPAARNPNRRHVWVVAGNLLAAVEVVIGLSDKSYTEIVSGDLAEGREVVVGIHSTTAKPGGGPPPPR